MKIVKNNINFNSDEKIINILYQFFFYLKKNKKLYSNFIKSINYQNIDNQQFLEFNKIIKNYKILINHINKFLKRNFYKQLFIEQAILLYGAYYLIDDVKKYDKALIINFCIEISKKYSSKNGYKFINAVLHKCSINE